MSKVFFRNDDVFEMGGKFEKLNDIFIKNGIPIHHSVIPIKLARSSLEDFIRLEQKNPGLIEYGQHGYAHKNHGDLKTKSEFVGRTHLQQKKDILKGKKIMEETFGEYFSPVFSPPYHQYDSDTLRVINDLGFKAFSSKITNKLSFTGYGFSFVPISMTFNKLKRGSKDSSINTASSIRQFVSLKKTTTVIGICLHHEKFSSIDFRNLQTFMNYLRKERVRFCRLSDVGASK
jgi:peptidoglycan/xylan/chitin deacetylase (PgdA/CDA1 family)